MVKADPARNTLCRPGCGRCRGPSRAAARCKNLVLALSAGVLLAVVCRRGVPRTSLPEQHSYIGNEDVRRVSVNWESSKRPHEYNDVEEMIYLPEREVDDRNLNLMPNIISENKGDYYVRKDNSNEDERRVSDNRESSKWPQNYNDVEFFLYPPERELGDRNLNLVPNTVSENKGKYYVGKGNRTTRMEYGRETANTDYLNTYKKKIIGSVATYRLTPSTATSAFPSTSNVASSSSSSSSSSSTTTTNITANLATVTASSVALATASNNLIQHIQVDETQKTILFYTTFFGGSWETFLRERTRLDHVCPVSSCRFLFESAHPEEADAVVFHADDIKTDSLPGVRRPDQLYIWLNMESPEEVGSIRGLVRAKPRRKSRRKMVRKEDEKLYGRPDFFNWTFTYHRDSDLLLLYGGLWPLKGDVGERPGLLNTSGSSYRDYVAALGRGELLQDMRRDWSAFLSRPKLAVWMVSHCSTLSGREFYVKELQRHLHVDVFGSCGDLRCGKTHEDVECYSRLLQPTYKFYLSFENNMCQDYITEKVWLVLHYGLVPVVYGGARYADFLPPHSYVDATVRTPRQLARLLDEVGNSPELYGRYHLWRHYWKVLLGPPLCELCLNLHHRGTRNDEDEKEEVAGRRQYTNLRRWWLGVNNCSSRYPLDRYPRPPEPDTRPFLQKIKDVFGIYVEAAKAVLPAARQQT